MTTEKKFEFTGETKERFGITLHQIRALRDFGNIKAGDIGGWLDKESPLSVAGNAWVSGDARVSGNADLICIGPIGSEGGTLVAHKDDKIGLRVSRGCFSGTLEEFEGAVTDRHGDNEHAVKYRSAVSFLKVYFSVE